jgi:hypothetical protein
MALLLCTSSVLAQESGVRHDSKAIEVLKKMSAFTESLDRVAITAVTFTDARLGAGLMISNSNEVHISIDRPGSLQVDSFDGEVTKRLYFHNEKLTAFNTRDKYYAQASIPDEIDAALGYALEELDVEAPLMDLIYRDASTHLISSQQTIIYVTGKARVAETDCHHIVIRGEDVDLQLWVEQGERPLPRKIMITSKWEGGSPRFWANLRWDTNPEFKQNIFEFKAPTGATKIEFVNAISEQ